MVRINRKQKWHAANLLILTTFTMILGVAYRVDARRPAQKMFVSSQEACAALLRALEQDDPSALLEILGPNLKDLISTGNDVEDRNSRQRFVEKYQQMHRLIREPNGAITLYVGPENWPMPILLAHKGNKWYFDPIASKSEILFRRIGRNELATIEVCRELVKAQNEFYARQDEKQFASTFMSDNGKHNGLYWKITHQEPESPVGEWLALASPKDYATLTTKPRPFHGYYYRILDRQGRHAPGGAKGYMVNGKMTRGFAFVAYPAEYRSSGVMTFIVNRDGIVYQKDLGPRTVSRAKGVTNYDPDATWRKAK
jgi:hypothetical protein